VSEGRSPYQEPGFLYAPPFSTAGAVLQGVLGERRLLLFLRHLNLAGACAAVWVSVLILRWPLAVRLLAAGVTVGLSPLVGNGLFLGNISLLVSALTLAGLQAAERRPVAAGVLLGSGLALKPLALPALALLALSRPPAGTGRARRVAALAGLVAAAGWLLLGLQHLAEMRSRAGGMPRPAHNVSLARALYCFGLEPPPAVLFGLVVAVGAAYVARRRLAGPELTVVAATVSLLALPIIWPHTFVLTYPVQARALERGVESLRAARADELPLRIGGLALVLAAILSLHGSQGVGAAPAEWPLFLQGLVTLIPLAALAGLGVFAIRRTRPES